MVDTYDNIEGKEEFCPIQNIEYPMGNKIPFERYFMNRFSKFEKGNRVYLNIQWTAYYVNNGYGKDERAISLLQEYLDSLDRAYRYFTIIQYDDGILNDVSGLDLLVFSMGCKKPGYYPIPLISYPLNNQLAETNEKDIQMSFIGKNTHPLRVALIERNSFYYVRFNEVSKPDYDIILRRTKFALCPRGYGITSFRMFEAMALGCVPVYISDEFWEPFNLPFDYGIKIRPDQIKDIPKILENADYEELSRRSKFVHDNYFTYEKCYETIIELMQ